MKRKKRPFTLLEILLVMGLIAMVMSLVGIAGARMVHEQRYKSEVESFIDHLQLAQDLMIIFSSNVHVKLTVNEHNGFDYQLHFDTNLPSAWAKELTRKHTLKYIHSITFQDEVRFPDEDPNTTDLKFFSNGYLMSKGIMQLSSSDRHQEKGVFHRYIALSGHPAKIRGFHHLEEATEYNKQEDMLNKQITNQTFEEIREKKDRTA